MSQRIKRNISVIAVGTIFLILIAPDNMLSMLLLVILTAAIGTAVACLSRPKEPS